jgi:hypothetical protein
MGSLYRYPPSSSCNIRRRSGAPSVPDISLLAERLPERSLRAESGISNPLPKNCLFLWALIASWVFMALALYGAWHLWRWITEMYGLDMVLYVLSIIVVAVAFVIVVAISLDILIRRRSTRRKKL